MKNLSPEARVWLAARKVPADTARAYGARQGTRRDVYGKVDLRDRLLFPLRDVMGAEVTVIGWKPTAKVAYLHPVYPKGRYLYGLWECGVAAYQAGHVLVTEGIFDVLAGFRLGYPTVGVLGSHLTGVQAATLAAFVPQAILILDADEAGRNGAYKGLQSLASVGVAGEVVDLGGLAPNTKDLDDAVRKVPAAVRARIETGLERLRTIVDPEAALLRRMEALR